MPVAAVNRARKRRGDCTGEVGASRRAAGGNGAGFELHRGPALAARGRPAKLGERAPDHERRGSAGSACRHQSREPENRRASAATSAGHCGPRATGRRAVPVPGVARVPQLDHRKAAQSAGRTERNSVPPLRAGDCCRPRVHLDRRKRLFGWQRGCLCGLGASRLRSRSKGARPQNQRTRPRSDPGSSHQAVGRSESDQVARSRYSRHRDAARSGFKPAVLAMAAGLGGELEITASPSGRNVVIGTNSGYANSTDFGETFTSRRRVDAVRGHRDARRSFHRVRSDGIVLSLLSRESDRWRCRRQQLQWMYRARRRIE